MMTNYVPNKATPDAPNEFNQARRIKANKKIIQAFSLIFQ